MYPILKVLHCLSNFFPDKTGGTEIYVAGLCHALGALGVSAIIVKPNFSGTASSYVHQGLLVKEYNETSCASELLQMGMELPNGMQAFKEILLAEQPDAVHFHETAGSNGISIYHLSVAKALGLAVFSTFHLAGNICMRSTFMYKGKYACNGIIDVEKCAVCMLQYRGLKGPIPDIIAKVSPYVNNTIASNGLRKIFNYPLYVQKHIADLQMVNTISTNMFVLSQWYRQLLVANGLDAEKIIVLPPPIATPTVAEMQPLALEPGKPVNFVYAGRIAAIKGLDIAIDALVALQNNQWKLDIYGEVFDEVYYNICLQKAANHPNIHWKGGLAHNMLLERLPQYHALLFPSVVQETMGLIILEAMAAGLAVIGSSIWSVQELTNNGRGGFLFEPGNTRALTTLLSQILEQPLLLQERLSNNAIAGGMELLAEKTFEAYNGVTVST